MVCNIPQFQWVFGYSECSRCSHQGVQFGHLFNNQGMFPTWLHPSKPPMVSLTQASERLTGPHWAMHHLQSQPVRGRAELTLQTSAGEARVLAGVASFKNGAAGGGGVVGSVMSEAQCHRCPRDNMPTLSVPCPCQYMCRCQWYLSCGVSPRPWAST